MNSKEYIMPDGKKAVFEYDHDGIGKVTIEAMDMLMGLITDGRKRGEWIEDYNNTYGRCRMKCSVCGKFSGIGGIKSNQRKPFCPNCGADMRKESE